LIYQFYLSVRLSDSSLCLSVRDVPVVDDNIK